MNLLNKTSVNLQTSNIWRWISVKYEKLELEIVGFDVEDVIRTSCTDDSTGGYDEGGSEEE